jgi:hypothetical protein
VSIYNKPITDKEFQTFLQDASGQVLGDLFDQYVHGHAAPPSFTEAPVRPPKPSGRRHPHTFTAAERARYR